MAVYNFLYIYMHVYIVTSILVGLYWSQLLDQHSVYLYICSLSNPRSCIHRGDQKANTRPRFSQRDARQALKDITFGQYWTPLNKRMDRVCCWTILISVLKQTPCVVGQACLDVNAAHTKGQAGQDRETLRLHNTAIKPLIPSVCKSVPTFHPNHNSSQSPEGN